MTKVTDYQAASEGAAVFICDYTPPRAGTPDLLQTAALSADFVSLAYNPGQIPRVSATMAAAWVKAMFGKEVLFTLATRDMNKVALQSALLGAQLWGLENVVVVQGDPFSAKERESVQTVNDIRGTELMALIREMNHGLDYRGSKLRAPTDFCIGASLDLGHDLDREIALTRRKRESGADFFLLQAVYEPDGVERFMEQYAKAAGGDVLTPGSLFCGVQIQTPESLVLGAPPEWVTADLAKGRPSAEIGEQIIARLRARGFHAIYLIPPVVRGGRRDYETVEAVISAVRR